MYNHILVPLDGSDFSEQALEPAFSIAEQMGGARVTLMSVMLRFPNSRLHIDKMDAKSEDTAKSYLSDLVNRLGPEGFPISLHACLGLPADEILDFAQDHNVDLIVMSTHGTTGREQDRYALGSTAWKVLHNAQCPVLLLPVSAAKVTAA